MFFTRAKAKSLLQKALTESPITILAMEAGSGKSRLIDSVFDIEGDFDTRHVTFIRLHEQITDFDALASCFTDALGHHLPDDSDPYEFILAAICSLPENAIIIIDEVNALNGQNDALQFISTLINHSGIYDALPKRRWLLSSRDVEDFPHTIWRADGKCRVLSDLNSIALGADELHDFEKIISLPCGSITSSIPREISVYYSALRAVRTLPGDISARSRAYHSALLRDQYDIGINRLLAVLKPEISSAILASSLAYIIDNDLMIELIDDINSASRVLIALDLAFRDLSSGHIKIDSVVRDALHQHLKVAHSEIVKTAVNVACQMTSNGADVKLGFDILIERNLWNELIELLSEYGISLLDRHDSYLIVAHAIAQIPEEIASRPEIDGLKGLLDARNDISDKAESWILYTLQNESLTEPLRRNILYRYCLELARRGRPDAHENLQKLLDYVSSEDVNDRKLQALAHSLFAALKSFDSPEGAMSHIERAMNLLTTVDDPFAQARVRYDCAYAFWIINEYERSILLCKEAAKIAVLHGFYDLAARAMTSLQDSAYTYEHNTPLAIHYLRCMRSYAKKAGDVRADVYAWLALYWLAVDSGSIEDIDNTYGNIIRYSLPDDFMQKQVQQTLVPGTAMICAGNGEFIEAIALIEPYVSTETDCIIRAWRWAELCLYYAASYVQVPDYKVKQKYLAALKDVRRAMCEIGENFSQEGDIAIRVCLSLILMERKQFVRSMMPYFENLAERDMRAPAMREMLVQMLNWTGDSLSIKGFACALQGLEEAYMGGLARIIFFLPQPQSVEYVIPTQKPADRYATV